MPASRSDAHDGGGGGRGGGGRRRRGRGRRGGRGGGRRGQDDDDDTDADKDDDDKDDDDDKEEQEASRRGASSRSNTGEPNPADANGPSVCMWKTMASLPGGAMTVRPPSGGGGGGGLESAALTFSCLCTPRISSTTYTEAARERTRFRRRVRRRLLSPPAFTTRTNCRSNEVDLERGPPSRGDVRRVYGSPLWRLVLLEQDATPPSDHSKGTEREQSNRPNEG